MMPENHPRVATDTWSLGDPLSFAWWKVRQNPFAITLTLLVALMLVALPNLVAGSIIASRGIAVARTGVVAPSDISDLYVQIGGAVAGWITAGLFLGGMYRYLLRLVRTGDASFGDLFSSMDRFGTLLGLAVILGLPGVALMAARPLLVTAGVPDLVVTVATIGVASYIAVRWGFSSILAVDKGLPIASALAESSRMTESKRWKLFGSLLVIGLVTIAGGCACVVGVFVTMSVGLIAWVNIYTRLTGEPSRGQVAEVAS
jgi:hypothetical protein